MGVWITACKQGRNWDAFWRGKKHGSAGLWGMGGQHQTERRSSQSLLFFSVLALLCVSVSGLIIQCKTPCRRVASSDRFSQINSAEQEQDVLASLPGTRQIVAAPGGSQQQ